MSELKTWVTHHKGLAIGGAIGLVLVLWFLLRSGGKNNAGASSDAALGNYYAAEAASSGAAAQQALGLDALNAESAKTAAGETIGLAALKAQTDQATQAAQLGIAQTNAAVDLASINANAATYAEYLHDYTALEGFVASPAAGANSGHAWGGLPTPGSIGFNFGAAHP